MRVREHGGNVRLLQTERREIEQETGEPFEKPRQCRIFAT
jgi:hypothetical protein